MPSRDPVPRRDSKSLDMAAPEAAACGAPFIVSVDARGVSPGRLVTIRIDCKYAGSALHPLGSGVFAPVRDRVAFASFKVVLLQPGAAVLLASAHDGAGAPFQPDAAIVRVT
jgi:hypothetical protein